MGEGRCEGSYCGGEEYRIPKSHMEGPLHMAGSMDVE